MEQKRLGQIRQKSEGKNILVVTQYFWPESFKINDLVKGLLERGNNVTVFTGLPNYPRGCFFDGYGLFGPYREKYLEADVFRVPLVSRGKKQGLRLALNYLSFVFFGCLLAPFVRGKFDVIFVYEVSPVTVALPAIVLKYIKRAPIIFWVTDLWPETLIATNTVKSKLIINWVAKLVRFIYRHCDHILVSCKGFIEKIKSQGVSEEKLLYWPQWAEKFFREAVDSVQSLPKDEVPKGFLVMFGGNIGTSQAFDTLIDAAERLKDYSDIHWVILGDGVHRDWVDNEVRSRELADCFHLLGSKPIEAVPGYYALADCLLVSLKKDPLFAITVPSKIQPYLASGKPVIASIDGEGAAVVEESNSGFCAPASDSKRLAEVVLKMYNLTPEQRRQLGQNAIKYFDENFEREMLLNRLEDMM